MQTMQTTQIIPDTPPKVENISIFNQQTDKKIEKYLHDYDQILERLKEHNLPTDYLDQFGFNKQEIESTMKVRKRLLGNLLTVFVLFFGGFTYATIRTYKLFRNSVPLKKARGPWLVILGCLMCNKYLDIYYENKMKNTFENSLIQKEFPENSVEKTKEMLIFYKVQKTMKNRKKLFKLI